MICARLNPFKSTYSSTPKICQSHSGELPRDFPWIPSFSTHLTPRPCWPPKRRAALGPLGPLGPRVAVRFSERWRWRSWRRERSGSVHENLGYLQGLGLMCFFWQSHHPTIDVLLGIWMISNRYLYYWGYFISRYLGIGKKRRKKSPTIGTSIPSPDLCIFWD